MSLTAPLLTPTCKRYSARLDLLALMLNSPQAPDEQSTSDSDSSHDSLSPLDDEEKDGYQTKGSSLYSVELSPNKTSSVGETCQSCPPIVSAAASSSYRYAQPEAGSRQAQTGQEPHFTFPDSQTKHEVATEALSTEACSPRFSLITRDHRPPKLTLSRTNGFTTLTVHELKQQICNGGTDNRTTKIQVSLHRSKGPPKTAITMGNKPSSVSGTPELGDNASVRSVVRKPARILRKSSTILFKRNDSKSPLPPELATAVIQVQQQVSLTTFDGSSHEHDVSPVDPFMDSNPPSNSADAGLVNSVSPVTITDENTSRPLSASTIVRESRNDIRRDSRQETHTAFVEGFTPEPESQQKQLHQAPFKRDSALSPSIPAPSPLPEDSPHKYGLKDRMDTPEVEEPEEINVVKARRRSSGLDIFNEAKSLQSASSFLNGLSTSRRRAESTQRSTETSGWTNATYDTTRPSSARVTSRPSSRPTSTKPSNTHSGERRRGHTFKPSGFAYTRPLTLAQMKCYRNHARLLPSRNKTAPVECSVCHIDDDRDHFSCSWCALRMCRFCRKDFAERGMTALKERIKHAELGGSSPSSSSESLGGRGRRTFA